MRTTSSVVLALVAASVLLSSCSITDPPPSKTTTSIGPSATATIPTYPAAPEVPDVRLTVTLLRGNALEQSTRHLVCVGSSAVDGTDFSGADESCELLKKSPDLLERKSAKTDERCEGTGNQNIADVFGEVNGKLVRNSFRRDNVCNVEVWDALASILGPTA